MTSLSIASQLKTGVGKLRPAGRMRPSRAFCAAREHFLKLCHLEINTTRGLTRRKSDGVLKKMVIASTLDGKCVRAYNCPQSGIYRLQKGEDLFFFRDTTNFARWDTTLPEDFAKLWANAISSIACSCTRQQTLALDHPRNGQCGPPAKKFAHPWLKILYSTNKTNYSLGTAWKWSPQSSITFTNLFLNYKNISYLSFGWHKIRL